MTSWPCCCFSCDPGFGWDGSSCVLITDCSIPRCSGNGYCVVVGGSWLCHCDEGWSGDDCSIEGGTTGRRTEDAVTLSTAGIAAIVVCLLIFLSEWPQQLFFSV